MAQGKITKWAVNSFLGCIGCFTVLGFVFFLFFFLSMPGFQSKASKLKERAVEASFSAAASTVVIKLAVEKLPPEEAIDETIGELNTYKGEDVKSPFDKSLPAYGKEPGPGVVVLEPSGTKGVELTAYDKDENVLVTKTIELPQ